MRIELVGRQGCHLCDEALTLLRALGIEPEKRDVDEDESLFRLFDFRVPVVLADGRIIAEGKVDAEALRRALRP